MALNTKVVVGASVVGVIALAGVATAAVLAVRSDGHGEWPDPVPGTYAEAPSRAWTYDLSDPDASLLFATDRLAVLSEDALEKGQSSPSGETITGIDIGTGTVVWKKTIPDAQCGGGRVVYSPDSKAVACHSSATDTVRFLNPETGEEIGIAPLVGGTIHLRIVGDVVYSCAANEGSVSFKGGDPANLGRRFAVEIPVRDSIACDLSVEGSYAAATSGSDDWVTVVGPEGEITYQSFSTSGRLRGEERLDTSSSDGRRSGRNYVSTVIDVNGNRVYEYMNPITNVLRSPGWRLAEIFIDDVNAVRDRTTGDTRWTYDASDEFSPLVLTGSSIVMLEDETRLRAYDVNTGQPLWARGAEQFYPSSADTAAVFFTAGIGRRTFAGDGEVVLIANGDRLIALDAASGVTDWTIKSPGHFVAQNEDYVFLADGETLSALKFG